jgi:Ca2+-binding RTX toxin-like protein
MSGGAGNDTYAVDDAGDTITEAAGAGTDTVKTSLASYTLTANVENLTFTGAGNFAGTGNTLANTITGGGGSDTLDGSSGNDKLLGGAGDDQLLGGAGNDSLTGGAGADSLTGGTGANRFIYTALTDFASGPVRDTILDFHTAEADKIDLSAINGIAAIAGSSFTFIGAAAFSNVAGQLHYVINGSGGVNVEGDTNGDGVADFTLVVNAVASLAGSDFVL